MSTWWIVLIMLVTVVVISMRLRAGETNIVTMEKIQQGALVIDVRTPAEFASGHYKGAINIPVADLQARLAEIGDKQKPLVVYCASGIRSAKAAGILVAAGFTDVTNAGTQGNLGQ